MWCSEEVIMRGIVLTPWMPRRATVVERDTKSDKWSGHVKVLEFVVSTPVRECDLWVTKEENRRQPWSLSQQGPACWQISDPWDKNYRVNLIHSVGLQSHYTSLYLLIHIVLM
jgi:hypothetical protein